MFANQATVILLKTSYETFSFQMNKTQEFLEQIKEKLTYMSVFLGGKKWLLGDQV